MTFLLVIECVVIQLVVGCGSGVEGLEPNQVIRQWKIVQGNVFKASKDDLYIIGTHVIVCCVSVNKLDPHPMSASHWRTWQQSVPVNKFHGFGVIM